MYVCVCVCVSTYVCVYACMCVCESMFVCACMRVCGLQGQAALHTTLMAEALPNAVHPLTASQSGQTAPTADFSLQETWLRTYFLFDCANTPFVVVYCCASLTCEGIKYTV